jgi:hypothetical protein
MTGFFSTTGFRLTVHTPQLPPDVQYLQLEQLLQALQVALPVHLADAVVQHESFFADTVKRKNKK